jgi:hypothetical protein
LATWVLKNGWDCCLTANRPPGYQKDANPAPQSQVRQDGAVEDIDFRHSRGLEKSLVLQLADYRWIKEHNNLSKREFWLPPI